VIYWGYAQIGYRDHRVQRFRDQVVEDQLVAFVKLVAFGSPGLGTIADLRLPQFSGISFVSKVLMFIDPERYCVLDKQLLKLGSGSGNRALHRVSAGTQIRITTRNEGAYNDWRAECAEMSRRYFAGRYRVVDIERGFFHLVQSSRAHGASEIYAAA
jgi:hypothetical protein